MAKLWVVNVLDALVEGKTIVNAVGAQAWQTGKVELKRNIEW